MTTLQQYYNIADNYKKYNLVDTKEDMIALLNILEAHKETLDSLHNAEDSFCSIYGNWKSDRDVVNALFEYNAFYTSEKEFFQTMEENAKDNQETFEEYIQNIDYRITTNGIVNILHY